MDKNVYITGISTTASADKNLLQNYEKRELLCNKKYWPI